MANRILFIVVIFTILINVEFFVVREPIIMFFILLFKASATVFVFLLPLLLFQPLRLSPLRSSILEPNLKQQRL